MEIEELLDIGADDTEAWVWRDAPRHRRPKEEVVPHGWRWYGPWVPCGYSDQTGMVLWRRRVVREGVLLPGSCDSMALPTPIRDPWQGEPPDGISGLLRSWLALTDYNQSDIARLSRTHANTVSAAFTGKSMSMTTLRRLLRAFAASGVELGAEELGQAMLVEAGLWGAEFDDDDDDDDELEDDAAVPR